MKIAIVGTGYVGLVTGTCFAEVGIDVTCVDVDERKIENLKKGIIPIFEPGLESMVKSNYEKGRLHFTTDLSSVVNQFDVIFSAVGTPPDGDGKADLQYVLQVAKQIGMHMEKRILIVTKSTVPVGTAPKVKEVIQAELDKRKLNLEFDVASNPEFLKEGDAINDFLKPDRIVCGVESDYAKNLIQRLYKPFTLNGHPIIFMDIASAEMTKYAANSMLATRISFINEIAQLCEKVGADINMVRKGIGSDPRIGDKFIYPGIGYGGSCFPKDVKALIMTGQENGLNLSILEAVESVNDAQKMVLFQKLNKYYKGSLKGRKIALWGLSFKPQTDDMRDAPSLIIIQELLDQGADVIAYDPVAVEECKHKIGNKITYANDAYEMLKDADALLLITEWKEFRIPDFEKIKQLMRTPAIFDGRNIYDKTYLNSLGFYYACIGVTDDNK